MPPPSRNVDLPLGWVSPVGQRSPSGRVRYRGPLAAADRPLRLHLGFDGSGPPFAHVAMEREDDGSWTAEVPDTGGRTLFDCAVSSGEDDWDNNGGADFRLWIGLDPVDAHVHVRTPGAESMGFQSLRTALASGGMTHALVSWQDNRFVDQVTAGVPWLTKLVWVSPGGPGVDEVRRRIADGAVGLKLHPTYDEYPADAPGLDPFLQVAADAAVPVAVHTAPGPSDPDLVRRLAERFPQVPFVLYHTFLGHEEGRRRAARHAQQLPNLHLETSWCRSAEVRRLMDEVGADRVLFGSDAAVDGPVHFVRTPPNIELVENYNDSLLALAGQLPAETLRSLLEDNTRRLFRLAPPRRPAREPAEDVAALLDDALAQAERVVSRVRADQFGLPTPCAEWDVQALVGHLLATVRRLERVAGVRPVSSVPAVAAVDPRGRWAATFAGAGSKARHACGPPRRPRSPCPCPGACCRGPSVCRGSSWSWWPTPTTWPSAPASRRCSTTGWRRPPCGSPSAWSRPRSGVPGRPSPTPCRLRRPRPTCASPPSSGAFRADRLDCLPARCGGGRKRP